MKTSDLKLPMLNTVTSARRLVKTSKLTEMLLLKAWDYLDGFEVVEDDDDYDDEEGFLENSMKMAKFRKKTGKNAKEEVPLLATLCLKLDITKATASRWAKENEEFGDIIEKLGMMQESALINKGLTRNFDASITKIMLNRHGWNEKVEIDQTVTIMVNTFIEGDAINGQCNPAQQLEAPRLSDESVEVHDDDTEGSESRLLVASEGGEG